MQNILFDIRGKSLERFEKIHKYISALSVNATLSNEIEVLLKIITIKYTVKRIICAIFVFVMALTILPLNVFAVTFVASGTCGDNVTWLLTADGTLAISGEGEMTDYAYLDTSIGQIVRSPWNEYSELITSVHVEPGVTTIGDDSFYNCINLTEVILSEGLTDIGKFAFDGCKSLQSIEIPRGVTNIDDGAFNECDRLVNVTIPDGVTNIGIGAFLDCDSLASITIPDSVESIERYAFGRNPNLISITFESATTEIYDSLYTISDSATIYGHANSTAQAYAEEYGREYVDISTLYTVGDLDGNDIIDNNDAIYLLYHTIFGEDLYPIKQDCDFDNNGVVDNNDAIYLLYYTIFGGDYYPLCQA